MTINQRVMSNEPSTNDSLLCRVSAGSAEGWSMFVQIYGPIVYRWIRRCGVQSADAADVMQDTLVAVTIAFASFDHRAAESSFRGWLWTIARNKLRDRQRRDGKFDVVDGSKAVRLMAAVAAESVDASDPPSSLDDDRRLAQSQAIECLRSSFDPRTWRMFWESAVVGRSVADIAEKLSVSPWAVYKAKS